jgi:biopolymer transport protein ExbD
MRRRHRHGGGDRPKAQIDMTSLIDLTFLLLVTFIITMPALEQGISIILPRAKTDTLPTKDNKATTITVDAANKIYLNNVPTSLEALEQDLLAKVAADPEVPVLVRGDERLTYGSVMDVVKLVYKCKVHRMALVTVEN